MEITGGICGIMRDEIDEIADEVVGELLNATKMFGPFKSAHEGYAIIKEEFDELWDEIKLKNPSTVRMREEAIQVAAMAMRFIHDIC